MCVSSIIKRREKDLSFMSPGHGFGGSFAESALTRILIYMYMYIACHTHCIPIYSNCFFFFFLK